MGWSGRAYQMRTKKTEERKNWKEKKEKTIRQLPDASNEIARGKFAML